MVEGIAPYHSQALHYLENARDAMAHRELEKAGEFLWGGMAEALKAIAASKQQILRSHAVLRRYARQLGRELNDPEITAAYARAERLHSNFYEVSLSEEDIQQEYEAVAPVVVRLLDLLPQPNGGPV